MHKLVTCADIGADCRPHPAPKGPTGQSRLLWCHLTMRELSLMEVASSSLKRETAKANRTTTRRCGSQLPAMARPTWLQLPQIWRRHSNRLCRCVAGDRMLGRGW